MGDKMEQSKLAEPLSNSDKGEADGDMNEMAENIMNREKGPSSSTPAIPPNNDASSPSKIDPTPINGESDDSMERKSLQVKTPSSNLDSNGDSTTTGSKPDPQDGHKHELGAKVPHVPGVENHESGDATGKSLPDSKQDGKSSKEKRFRVAIKFEIGEGWRGTKSRDFPGRHFLLEERNTLFEWAEEFRNGHYLYSLRKPSKGDTDKSAAFSNAQGTGTVVTTQSDTTVASKKGGGSNDDENNASLDCLPDYCIQDVRVVPLPPGQSGFKRRKPFVGITEVHRQDAFLWFRETFQRLLSSVVANTNSISTCELGKGWRSFQAPGSAKTASAAIMNFTPNTYQAHWGRKVEPDVFIEIRWDKTQQPLLVDMVDGRVPFIMYLDFGTFYVRVNFPCENGDGAYFRASDVPPGEYIVNGAKFRVLPPKNKSKRKRKKTQPTSNLGRVQGVPRIHTPTMNSQQLVSNHLYNMRVPLPQQIGMIPSRPLPRGPSIHMPQAKVPPMHMTPMQGTPMMMMAPGSAQSMPHDVYGTLGMPLHVEQSEQMLGANVSREVAPKSSSTHAKVPYGDMNNPEQTTQSQGGKTHVTDQVSGKQYPSNGRHIGLPTYKKARKGRNHQNKMSPNAQEYVQLQQLVQPAQLSQLAQIAETGQVQHLSQVQLHPAIQQPLPPYPLHHPQMMQHPRQSQMVHLHQPQTSQLFIQPQTMQQKIPQPMQHAKHHLYAPHEMAEGSFSGTHRTPQDYTSMSYPMYRGMQQRHMPFLQQMPTPQQALAPQQAQAPDKSQPKQLQAHPQQTTHFIMGRHI